MNAFDDLTPSAPAGETSQDGINLLDRAYKNMKDAFYEGTLAGAGLEAGQLALSSGPEAARIRALIAERQNKFNKLQAWWQRWNKDDLTLYDLGAGAAEGAAALTGQLVGSLPTPENFIPIPGAKSGINTSLRLARPRLTSALVSGSSAAAINIASDPFVQAMNIYKGSQEHYDLGRTMIGGAMGGIIGMGAGAMFPSRATDITPGSAVRPRRGPAPPVYVTDQELMRLYQEMTSLPKMAQNWKAIVQANKPVIDAGRTLAASEGIAMRADPKVALYDLYLTRPDFLERFAPQAKQQLDNLFDAPPWKDVVDAHKAIAQERVVAYSGTLDAALNDLRFRTAGNADPNQGQTFHEIKRQQVNAGRGADLTQADRPAGVPGPGDVANAAIQRIVTRLKVKSNSLDGSGGDYQALLRLLYGNEPNLSQLKTAMDGMPQERRGEFLLRNSKKIGKVADAVRMAVGGDPREEPIVTVLRSFVETPNILAHVDSPFYDRLADMLRERYPIDHALIKSARELMSKGKWRPTDPAIQSLPLDPIGDPNASAAKRPAQGLADPNADVRGLSPTNPELPSPTTIIHNLSRGLGLTVRQGGVRGSVRYQNGVFRVRNSKDVPMIAGGAAVHVTQTQMVRNAEGFRLFTRALAPQLRTIKNTSPLFANVADAAGTGKVADDELAMDFANFVYLYLMNPPLVDKNYRALAQQFEAFYTHNDPQMLTALQRSRQEIQTYFTMPSQDALASRIVSAGKKNFFAKLGKTVEDLGYDTTFGAVAAKVYTGLVDDLHPLQVAVRSLARLYAENTGKKLDLKIVRDPYRLARMSRGAEQAGHMDLRYGVTDYRGLVPEGPALVDALEFATGSKQWDEGAVETFGRYLTALRFLTEWKRYYDGELSGPPDMETPGGLLTVVDELDAAHPTFRQAADLVHEFTRRMWKKKFDAGFITKEEYERQLKRPFYAPVMRDVDEKTRASLAKMSATGSKGMVFRFNGSDRDVINPIHAIMFDAHATAMRIAENDVKKALLELAEAVGPEGTRIVERLRPDNTKDGQGVATVQDVLARAQRYDDLAPQDADLIAGVLGDDFNATGSVGKSPTGEGIVHYAWINGEKVGMRFADGAMGQDLAFTLSHMNGHVRDIFLRLVAKPTSILSTTITATSEFALANLLRDQVASPILNKHFIPVLTPLSGMKSEISQDLSAQIYNRVYGIFGGAATSALHGSKINAELALLKRRGYLMQRLSSAKEFLRLAEITETGNRLGLFKTVFALKKKEGLTDYEAAMEASYVARDLLDYNRRGSRMQHATRLILFLNPYIQGLDKLNRTALVPIMRHLRGDVLTKQEAEELPQSLHTWAMMVAGVGMIGAALSYIYADDEEYNNISDYYRSTHWMVRWGDKWFSWPKPFELAVFSNIFERSVEAAYRGNELAKDKMLTGVVDVVTPPMTNPLYNVGTAALYGIDPRSGDELIPMGLQGLDPAQQYTERTSEMAKRIGKAIGVSPIMIDYAILNTTGSWGRDTLTYTNRMIDANRPANGVDDAWVSRRFIRDWSRGSLAAKEFWDRMGWKGGRMSVSARTFHRLRKDGDAVQAERYLSGLPEDEQLYAMMNELGRSTLRMHPLERASEAARAISKMRRELLGNDEPYLQKITPQQKQIVDDVMSELAAKEMHNAMVLIGARGYENRKMFDTIGQRDLLKHVSKDVYDEYLTRLNKAHVVEWQVVRDFWPKVRAEVQANGIKRLRDEMLTPFPETFNLQTWKADSQALTGQRPIPNAFADY